jgi:hypothetical protein
MASALQVDELVDGLHVSFSKLVREVDSSGGEAESVGAEPSAPGWYHLHGVLLRLPFPDNDASLRRRFLARSGSRRDSGDREAGGSSGVVSQRCCAYRCAYETLALPVTCPQISAASSGHPS